jgi:hypothetical protein
MMLKNCLGKLAARVGDALLKVVVWLWSCDKPTTPTEAPAPAPTFTDVSEPFVQWRIVHNVEPTTWLREQLSKLEAEVSSSQPKKLPVLLIGNQCIVDYWSLCNFGNGLLQLARVPQTEQAETLPN